MFQFARLLSIVVCFTGLTIASTPQAAPIVEASPANSTEFRVLSPEEIHANVMRRWPAERIITSTEIDDYISTHAVELASAKVDERTLYIRDTGTWITFEGPITPENSSLSERQFPCMNYHENRVKFPHEYWAPWAALSSCEKQTKGSGGSLSFGLEESYSVSYGGGIEAVDPLKAILSVAFSFEITYGYTTTRSYSCNVNQDDSGQVWGRHRIGWAAIEQRQYFQCGWEEWYDKGWVASPASQDDPSRQQYGCSVKSRAPLKGC